MNNLLSYCGLVDAKKKSFWQRFTCTDWLAAKGKGLEAKQNMEDFVERIIYAVITVNAYQKKSKTGDFLEEPETQGNLF